MPLRGPGAWSRETRLLWLTIAVSFGVLFVLAQFRFPSEERLAPAPQPLERLAARATYEELAADVARLERRIAPALLVLRVHSTRAPAPDRCANYSIVDGLKACATVVGPGACSTIATRDRKPSRASCPR